MGAGEKGGKGGRWDKKKARRGLLVHNESKGLLKAVQTEGVGGKCLGEKKEGPR